VRRRGASRDAPTDGLCIAHQWRALFVREAARVVGDADAEDLVQEALIRLWQRGPAPATEARVVAWVLTTIRRLGLSWVKRRSHRAALLASLPPPPSVETPEAVLLRADLERALAELPHREAVLAWLRGDLGRGSRRATYRHAREGLDTLRRRLVAWRHLTTPEEDQGWKSTGTRTPRP
jgi:hypothetical protein